MATAAPSTDRAVEISKTANDLFNAAESNPIAKADLQALFDSISHGGAVTPALVAMLAAELAQHNITLDNQLLTLLVGVAVAGASYLWQWAMIKLNKPTKP